MLTASNCFGVNVFCGPGRVSFLDRQYVRETWSHLGEGVQLRDLVLKEGVDWPRTGSAVAPGPREKVTTHLHDAA